MDIYTGGDPMTTYAIPLDGGGYRYLDDGTTETFSIGEISFPPPYLKIATDLASRGILAAVDTPMPSGDFASITSSFQMVNGVPTRIWVTTPAGVPQSVKNWQGLAAMAINNLDAPMRDAIAGLPSPQNKIVQAAYDSADFVRSSPTLNQLLAAIGQSPAQIDALFIQAAGLSL